MAAVAENGIGAESRFVRPSPPQPIAGGSSSENETEYQRDVRKLVDLLSKLNPSAKEFFPSSYPAPAAPPRAAGVGAAQMKPDGRLSADAPVFVASTDYHNNVCGNQGRNQDSLSDGAVNNHQLNRRRRNGFNQGRRRMGERMRRADREDSIRRTVYVSDIDTNVTEEHLAELFATCGQVVDCRVCGDPHSVLRFAFIEFADENCARAALSLGGMLFGFYPLRVLPSKTAILPVNPKFLPRSNDEREMVVRTVYCTNIDKKVTQSDVRVFFEQVCGEVSRIRLLGDNVHSTRIAFVEFAHADCAIAALSCSGTVLGALPIRVSPSKTPVRTRMSRATSY